MEAHWILIDRIKETYPQTGSIKSYLELSYALIKNLGISGSISYFKGFFGIGKDGIQYTKNFFSAINNKDQSKWIQLFKDNSSILRIIYKQKHQFCIGENLISSCWNKTLNSPVVFNTSSFYPSGWRVSGDLVYVNTLSNQTANALFIIVFDKNGLIVEARIMIDLN